MPSEDTYFNQILLSILLNASEIRQMEYRRTYSHQKKKFEREAKQKMKIKIGIFMVASSEIEC